jgi:DNA-binding NarL/FixJ family response regulator
MPAAATPEVLLVEDDPNFATRLCAAVMLWQPEARITLCATGADAIARIAASQQPVDLALVNLGLPDMDGSRVIAALRRRFADAPILVVSLLTSERAVLTAIRSGANGYILKDGSNRSTAVAITEVIAGNYPLSPALARHLFRLVTGPAPHSDIVLTDRETDTLRGVGRGLTYEQTAMQMEISLSTVQSHVRNLYRKLIIHSQTQAAIVASDRGLV